MLKRILLFSLGFLFFSLGLGECQASPSRALFVSVIQVPPVLESRQSIDDLITFAQKAHINMLFVQVYHSGQAWFPSRIVDNSWYKMCYRKVGEDPLRLLIKEAHQQGIQVHAWLNLMSLGQNTQAYFLHQYGTQILTQNLQKKNDLKDFRIDNQYFLEPGDPRVRRGLAEVVAELVDRYPELDGVQFDYIRYPDVHPHYGYTKINIARFKKATGLKVIDEASTVWQDWRRAQVTEVVKLLVKTVHAKHPNMMVSTTGCMPYARAMYEAYQDWPLWISEGIIDFVTIMDYSTDVTQFNKWIGVIKDETGKDFSKVRIAVGAEKLVHDPATFEKEFTSCEQRKGACTVFHYGNLLENPELQRFLCQRS